MERDDTEASVCKAWAENALPTHQRLIEPQRVVANLVLSGEADVRDSVREVVAWLGVRRGLLQLWRVCKYQVVSWRLKLRWRGRSLIFLLSGSEPRYKLHNKS